jgi:hypothetical protein
MVWLQFLLKSSTTHFVVVAVGAVARVRSHMLQQLPATAQDLGAHRALVEEVAGR